MITVCAEFGEGFENVMDQPISKKKGKLRNIYIY